MSDKTKSDQTFGDSIETGLSKVRDRWTNDISFGDLIVSLSLNIYLFAYNPYLHELKHVLPFLFLTSIFHVILGYPFLYMELLLGTVTLKGIYNCWDLSPIGRGVGIAMLGLAAFTAFASSVMGAYCLYFLVHSFHTFLPWMHCITNTPVACTPRGSVLANSSETPAESYIYGPSMLRALRDGLKYGLGIELWQIVLFYIVSWYFVFAVSAKGTYTYSKAVTMESFLAYFLLVSSFVGAVQLKGSGKVLEYADWSLVRSTQAIIVAAETSLLQMMVGQGTGIMVGSLNRDGLRVGRAVGVTLLLTLVTNILVTITLGGVYGALHNDFMFDVKLHPSPIVPLVLWADLVVRFAGNQFWSALFFFTLFFISISTTSLLLNTLMSVMIETSYFKIKWLIMILTISVFAIIGILTLCSQGGLYTLRFLMFWPVSLSRLGTSALAVVVVVLVYGERTFRDNVSFVTKREPNLFVRGCWFTCPILAFLLMFSAAPAFINPKVFDAQFPTYVTIIGWILSYGMFVPVFVMMLVYFVFRVRIGDLVE